MAFFTAAYSDKTGYHFVVCESLPGECFPLLPDHPDHKSYHFGEPFNDMTPHLMMLEVVRLQDGKSNVAPRRTSLLYEGLTLDEAERS